MYKKEGDNAIVNLKNKNNLTKKLTLSYYGNQLGVYFSIESILAHAISLEQKVDQSEFISLERITSRAEHIHSIFKNEFMPNFKTLDLELVKSRFEYAHKKGIYRMNETKDAVALPKNMGVRDNHLFFK